MEFLGCTEQRKQHSKVVIEPREVTRGGIPKSYGQRVVYENYLDYLADKGYLGSGVDQRDRYNVGIKLRNLYYSFNRQDNSFKQGGGGSFVDYVNEGDIGVGDDFLEAKYNAIMKATPIKYRPTVRFICVEAELNVGTSPAYIQLVQDALDALYGAFARVEGVKR